MSSYSDGQVYKTHPLFKQHSNGLQLILYYDDVEMCNPLGSKRKIHKLGKEPDTFGLMLIIKCANNYVVIDRVFLFPTGKFVTLDENQN